MKPELGTMILDTDSIHSFFNLRDIYDKQQGQKREQAIETVVGGRKGALHVTAGEKGISISSIWQVHNRETEDGVELDKDSGTTTLMFVQKEFLVSFLPLEVVGRWVPSDKLGIMILSSPIVIEWLV